MRVLTIFTVGLIAISSLPIAALAQDKQDKKDKRSPIQNERSTQPNSQDNMTERGSYITEKADATGMSGVADDTPALRAILAATAANSEAVIGPGTFLIQPQGDKGPMLPVTKNMVIRCAAGTVLRIADGKLVGGLPGVVLGGYNTNGVVVPLSQVVIEDCTIDGNDQQNSQRGNQASPYAPPAIQFGEAGGKTNGITIRNMHFVDLTFGAIWLFNVDQATIVQNDIYRSSQSLVNADAIQLNGVDQAVVSNNHLANVGEGIFVQHSTSTLMRAARNVVVSNNTIESLDANGVCTSMGEPFSCCNGKGTGSGRGLCAKGVIHGSSIGVLAQDVLVNGNSIRKASQISVQAGRGFPTERVSVTNNISSGSNANCLLVYGLAIASSSETLRSVRLAGNRCLDFQGQGIELISASSAFAVQDVDIDHNTFDSRCGVNCSAQVFLKDVGGRGVSDIRLTSNSFVRWVPLKPVIRLEHVQGLVAHRNTLTGQLGKSISFPIPDSTAILWSSNWALRYADLLVLAANGVANRSLAYCLDCKKAALCGGGGSGAQAKRAGAHWRCN